MTPSVEIQALSLLRTLALKTLKSDPDQKFICRVPEEVAYYMLNTKREELLDLETKRQVVITIEIDKSMVSGQNSINCA
jgi:ribonuclease E